ncbi:MAG: hypothetical protein JWQ11_3362 [Rhizobacter sp.]|nr:hypothetical protein [Rhizobacter sp.]
MTRIHGMDAARTAHKTVGRHSAPPLKQAFRLPAKRPLDPASASVGTPSITGKKPQSEVQQPDSAWSRLDRPLSTAEHDKVMRMLTQLRPHDSAWSVEGERAGLVKEMLDPAMRCFDILEPSRNGTGKTSSSAGPRFSASIHPTPANIESFVDQLYKARTECVGNLARANEYGLKDPAFYNTHGETVEIGDYLVTGTQRGVEVPLGMNMPAAGETSRPITLRFYEMKIRPKADADNPAATHTVHALDVDQLTDGSSFEPGHLTRLAMYMLKSGASSIHVNCHGGFDRTGMTIAMCNFLKGLLERNKASDPIVGLKECIDAFRTSRGEPTAIQGDNQLAALAGECLRLARMDPAELQAIYKRIHRLGFVDTGPHQLIKKPTW